MILFLNCWTGFNLNLIIAFYLLINTYLYDTIIILLLSLETDVQFVPSTQILIRLRFQSILIQAH